MNKLKKKKIRWSEEGVMGCCEYCKYDVNNVQQWRNQEGMEWIILGCLNTSIDDNTNENED